MEKALTDLCRGNKGAEAALREWAAPHTPGLVPWCTTGRGMHLLVKRVRWSAAQCLASEYVKASIPATSALRHKCTLATCWHTINIHAHHYHQTYTLVTGTCLKLPRLEFGLASHASTLYANLSIWVFGSRGAGCMQPSESTQARHSPGCKENDLSALMTGF